MSKNNSSIAWAGLGIGIRLVQEGETELQQNP